MQELPLQELAEVLTGYPFRSKVESAPDGDLRVIQGKDVEEGRVLDPEALTRIRLPGRSRPHDKLMRKDDVIIMVRTERPFAVHLACEMPPTVVQNSFNTLRLHSTHRMSPEFLAMILNQSLVRARIAAFLKGTNIPYLRVEDLRAVPVPVPPLDRQRLLVAMAEAQRRERDLHRELELARQQRLDALILAK
ncbi:MAG: restriction endonuclease subunit S [Verrucomicrobiales bacterium]|nr:restriction endonuclease subunit S [Verrucomicrobiales bacterium]